MNLDNQRLREIKRFKEGYHTLMDKSESLSEILDYQNKINELEREEKEIFERCDVII